MCEGDCLAAILGAFIFGGILGVSIMGLLQAAKGRD